MIHIQVVCPDPNDATSFYRGVGPMSRLRKLYPKEIHTRFITEMNWSTIVEADIVFMQRPFHSNHRSCASMVKGANIPLWIDYDDNLFGILSDNPVHGIYANPEVQQNVAQLCGMADIVTVSTSALHGVLSKYSQNVRVVPNALDDQICNSLLPRPVPDDNYIFWRGTNTHERDLRTIEQELIELSYDAQLANWKFAFVGYNPWWITEKMKPSQVLVSAGAPIVDYMRAIYDMQPRIMIVPLAKNTFNESKSNIAWIEGSYGGAATIAQDMDEFKMPGVLTYETPKEFVKCVKHLVEAHGQDPDALYVRNQESWNYIQQNLTLKLITERRRGIVSELLRTAG